MKKIAIIWKKSIYDNQFRCSECGAKLLDENGRPSENIIDGGTYLLCKKCNNFVAAVRETEAEVEETNGIRYGGEWKGGDI